MRTLTLLAALAILLPAPASAQQRDCSVPSARAGRYAVVNGLRMYYEVHGTGRPLVLIHGALTTIQGSFGRMLPDFACGRQVIAVELQAHGRTADNGRPFSYEQAADDVAALLRHLRIEQADILGYSMGGATALRLTVRHPSLVRRLVVVSAGYNLTDGLPNELRQFMAGIDTASAPWSEPFRQEFAGVAPRPDQWSRTLQRAKESVSESGSVTVEQLRAIQSPTLIIVGDRDIVPFDHLARFYQSLAKGQLAVLPGTDHFPGIVTRSDDVVRMVIPFLDAP
jgi:pimeloyl-ACP methyl ester carboxylesterase